jgi:hypothetical protein
VVAARDTVFRHDTVERAIAVGDYRQARAQLVITDTVQVRSTFLKADVALAKDSATLASATSLIAAHVELEAAQGVELAIARQPAPRLSGSVAALYDPFAHVPALAAQGQLRVAGGWSTIARAEQRFASGERPRGYLGASRSF